MRNLFLELGELRPRGMHWPKFMAEYRTQRNSDMLGYVTI